MNGHCIVLHYMHIWHLRIRASSLQFRASKINMALARMNKLVKKLMSNPGQPAKKIYLSNRFYQCMYTTSRSWQFHISADYTSTKIMTIGYYIRNLIVLRFSCDLHKFCKMTGIFRGRRNRWPMASIFMVGPVKLNKDRPAGPVDILGPLGPATFVSSVSFNID